MRNDDNLFRDNSNPFYGTASSRTGSDDAAMVFRNNRTGSTLTTNVIDPH